MTLLRRVIAVAAFALVGANLPATAETPLGDTIRLGQSGPQTGPLAELNRDYLSGISLYFDQANAAGGIHGRKVEVVALDDAYDPDQTERNTRSLIAEQGVFAFFGVFGTGQNRRAIPVAIAAGVPYFAPYTGADILREPSHPLVFHFRASYGREIEAMIDHLATSGVTTIALIHHADAFGEAGLRAAEQALSARGRPPLVAVASIAANGDGAEQVAAQIAGSAPAAVILVAAGRTPPILIREMRARDLNPMLFGLSVVSSRELVRELGAEAHGVVLAQVTPSPFRIDHPVVRDYQRAAKKAGQDYGYAALEGYMAAKTFSEALRRAGRELTRETLVKSLESLKGWDVGGLSVDFSTPHRVGLSYVDLSVVSHGRFSH